MTQAMDIERWDLEIKANNISHHTELNGDESLIVRRGQPFIVNVYLKPGGEKFTPGKASFTLIVETGPLPRKESDTKVCFGLRDYTVDTEWSASLSNGPTENAVSLSISSSPNAPIGLYSLTLDQDGTKTRLGEFVLLFNAWCARDAVYMRNEEKRQEYVLAQHGFVYKGTPKRIRGTPWNFGQFEPSILDVCLKILDKNPKFVSDADQDSSARRNPVYVTRVLSAMINSCDDRGVLVGNWSGDYEDGEHPGHWIGSGDILRKWAESGSVSYGQCWVFAAVACTVSRALGIPCRVVTNFGSAHDTNANLIIEQLYDEDGKRMDDDDSIWNFHVWVDSWMSRPDLGLGFDGWQASDPTPQEKSEGVYCCGPVPLTAIKEGELTKKYDGPFVFAEVNADVVELVQLTSGELYTFSTESKSVGQCISTKAVGSDRRQDITHQYKYPEGSEEERRVFEKAKHTNKLQQRGEEPGIQIKIKLADNMTLGSDFEVHARITNNTLEAKVCSFMLFAFTVSYDGKRGEPCGFTSEKLKLPIGEEKRVPLKLEYANYGSALTPDRLIQLSAFAIDKETSQFHKADKTIVLDVPELEIKLLGEATVNESITAVLSMMNPLPEPLKDCCFNVEGVGLTQGKMLTLKVGAVGANQEARAKVEFTPSSAGPTVLLMNFDSDKLKHIQSSIKVAVMDMDDANDLRELD